MTPATFSDALVNNRYPILAQLTQQYLEQLEPLLQCWGLLPEALPALGLLALLHHPELVADLLPEMDQDYDTAGHLDQLYQSQPARSIPETADPVVIQAVKVTHYLD